MRIIVILFDSASFLLRCELSGAKCALFPVVCAPFLVLGLYKLWNPAIPNWKTWRKFWQHGEHGKDQPVELKHFICDSKYFNHDSKQSLCQPDESKQSLSKHISRQMKNHDMSLEQRWAYSVLMTEYEYEYYSVSQKRPNTNTSFIRFPKNDRIQIRILFGYPEMTEYEYYSASQ